MAEIVGTVAAVAQLLDLSGTLLAGGYGFLSKVSRAPTEIRNLLTETAAINSVLGQLQLIAEPAAPDNALHTLVQLGVFEECHTALQFVGKALATCQEVDGKNVKNFGKRLLWPFKEKETKDALQRIHHLRGLLANAIEANSARSLHRIEASQDVLIDRMEVLATHVHSQISREETQTILAWLCPLSPAGAYTSLETALGRRLLSTGTWFLESADFQDWLNSKHSALWITGLPGSGKTLLCASAIEKTRQIGGEKTAVLFFFCDHRDPTKLTHENFIMSITRQMLTLSSNFMGYVKKHYDEKASNGDRSFNRAESVPLIETFIKHFEDVFILCDALDESTEGDAIASTLERLYLHGVHHGVSTKILFTSRFDIQTERRHALITSNRIALTDNMKQDIESYVKKELGTRVSMGALKLRDKSLAPLVQEQVVLRAGTILHARLQLDYLSTARNDKDVKTMVQALPDGLEYTYEALLSDAASRSPDHVAEMKILLRCLAVAAPELSAAHLAEIIAMRPGERYLDFDAVATDPYDTLDVIAPLVVIDRDSKSQSTVRLCHYSLDEYLFSEHIRRSRACQFHVDYREANAWLASICLQYITFDIFNSLEMEFSGNTVFDNYTFRRYAALNWSRHYTKAKGFPGLKELCDPYLKLLLHSIEGSPCYGRMLRIVHQAHPRDFYTSLYPPICLAINLDLEEVVDDLLPILPTVDHLFDFGYTCLSIAAEWDRPSIARKLLGRGARVDQPVSTRSLTPLHIATEHASQDVFDLLLAAGADPHARSRPGTTPFYRACRGGNIHMVRKLKACGSDINVRTYDNWTPIMEAVENGHEDIVDLLLEWGADVNVVTDQNETALTLAEDPWDLVPNPLMTEKVRKAVLASMSCDSEVGGQNITQQRTNDPKQIDRQHFHVA